MKQYFSHREVLELYFDIYGEEIKKRIANLEDKDNIADSNKRYISKNGDLNIELVKRNIKELYYN